ncbi:dicarboxylate/amino acid:cation symporter [Gelria sp. Kuro-4]|uniref:dicarboxylate/amino acid:cation symporter n=1 Tax=Gelria sp. Kuro-4 TaxID=2796927 RepID=UPI002105EA2E|nr:dicarboxylate/amino acid:cation symporter [Gelria sp. Kuro-4]
MKKLGLLPRLLLGIACGILIGALTPEAVVKILVTFSGIFGNFLNFVIPLIIIGFVAPGIAELGQGAGRLLGITTGLAYLSTLIAGTAAYLVSSVVLPVLTSGYTMTAAQNPEEALLKPFFTVDMPPVMGVMSALLTAFILGLGVAALKGRSLRDVLGEFQQVVEGVIQKAIIPLLPIHVAGIFANMTYAGEVMRILTIFGKVFMLVILLHIAILFFQYFTAAAIGRRNPFVALRNMLPAYFTAIGTQSSAATIPVTLRCAKTNGVSDEVADFAIPLCATIHLSGSTITLTTCSLAVILLAGHAFPSLAAYFPFIMMLGITMVAAPGVPGGAVMAALGILQSMLGFTEAQLGLMIALYLTQDSFGTACNVTGDCAISIIVDTLAGNGHRREKLAQSPAAAR